MTGFKDLKSGNTDYHINLSKGKKNFRNKDMFFSESPFVAQVNHLFEETYSKETVLQRSDLFHRQKQPEPTTGDTQKWETTVLYKTKKTENHNRNLVFLSKQRRGRSPKASKYLCNKFQCRGQFSEQRETENNHFLLIVVLFLSVLPTLTPF